MAASNPVKGMIVDIETGDKVEFQYNPPEISDSQGANWVEINVPGMSHPRVQFTSGGVRELSFTVEFSEENVKKKVNFLQSLVYPEHAGSLLKNAPHKALFVFGTLYNLVCILRSVKARYHGNFTQQLEPKQASIDLVLHEFTEKSVNFSEGK